MEAQGLGQGLGSLSNFMNDKPGVVDLSWLEVVPGENYDNIPSTHNPHDVIPQLVDAWGWENYSSPTGFITKFLVERVIPRLLDQKTWNP